MTEFWKTVAMVLVTSVLCIAVGRQTKEFSVILAMVALCIAAGTLTSYLEPVFEVINKLELMGNIQNGIISILMKISGIALVSELAGMVCMDAGNGSLAKIVQIVGSVAILYLSIPLIELFLTLIQDLLGK